MRPTRLLAGILITAGTLSCFAGAYSALIAYYGQEQAAKAWEKLSEAANVKWINPKPPPPALDDPRDRPGSVIGRLSFPRLDKTRFVLAGETAMKSGPTWLLETAVPGKTGNSVIAGHRDTHFRFLKDVRKGDTILVNSAGSTYRYTVTTIKIVSPRDVSLLSQVPNKVLTLVTCYPFYYIGSAPKRYIVRAEADFFSDTNQASGG